jgi:phosphoenolpyruvate-protein kinase (PTS system EI component)
MAHLDTFDRLAALAVDAIAFMADHEFEIEVVSEIRATAGAISELNEAHQTEVTPPAAADPLRTLLERIAVVIDALAAYLEQIYDDSYLETGAQATNAILCAVAIVPSLRAEIASLRAECDGA